jgi:hypothetical protein
MIPNGLKTLWGWGPPVTEPTEPRELEIKGLAQDRLQSSIKGPADEAEIECGILRHRVNCGPEDCGEDLERNFVHDAGR